MSDTLSLTLGITTPPAHPAWWWVMAAVSCFSLTALLALLYFVWRSNYWWVQGVKLLADPGYLTPRVTWFARRFRYYAFLVVRRWYVGRVRTIRQKKLTSFKGRVIVVCNHQTERDALVLPPIMGFRNVRGLMASTQLHGIRVPLAAWQGIVAVHYDGDQSKSVRTAIRVLQKEKRCSMFIFPQGRLVRDNHLKREDFHEGTIVIARGGARKSELPVALVPAAIAYDRDETHKSWMHSCLDRLNLADRREFFGETTYGATLAIGNPILLQDLPEDREAAMTLLFDEIVELSEQAQQAIAY